MSPSASWSMHASVGAGLGTRQRLDPVLVCPQRSASHKVFASTKRSRQTSLTCNARSTLTRTEELKQKGVVKVDGQDTGLVSVLQQSVISPFTLLPIALGAGAGFFLQDGVSGAQLGAAAGAALRAVQLLLLEQTVPFTERRHTLLLPVPLEMTMGRVIYQQQMASFQNNILPESHADYKLVHKISDRVIAAVEKKYGGGFQKHLERFDWEVTVVDNKTPNAFVLPGGKIVVFTGIIKLLDRREDLLAAVIGHECAHALARHSTEKLSLGLFITATVNLVAAFVQFNMRRQNPQGRGPQPDPFGGRGGQWGQPGGSPYGGRPMQASYGGPRGGYGYSNMRRPSYGRQMPGYGRGGGGSPLLNPQVISIFTNLFLQLPFSRRAEAEADLIGLKLMALAGYNPKEAPETFRRLAIAETNRPGGAAGTALTMQCTHPRSSSRVQMLEEELAMMEEHGDRALDKVMHKIPYWML